MLARHTAFDFGIYTVQMRGCVFADLNFDAGLRQSLAGILRRRRFSGRNQKGKAEYLRFLLHEDVKTSGPYIQTNHQPAHKNAPKGTR